MRHLGQDFQDEMMINNPLFYMMSAWVVIMIPGPLSLLMVKNTVRYGIARSLPAFAGGTLASAVLITLSCVGLGAIILASDAVFLGMQVLGTVYILYLGVKEFSHTKKHATHTLYGDTKKSSLFKEAFLLGASNPKDIAFFVAFLPQFMNHQQAIAWQLFFVVVIWVMLDFATKLLYGYCAQLVSARMDKIEVFFSYFAMVTFLLIGLVSLWNIIRRLL